MYIHQENINKISYRLERNVALKNKYIKDPHKKHCREIMHGALFLYMHMYMSIDIIPIKRWMERWNKNIHGGETTFAPLIDGRISNANLKSFILFGNSWTEPSEHISEYMLLSVALIVFKYSCIFFCLISTYLIYSAVIAKGLHSLTSIFFCVSILKTLKASRICLSTTRVSFTSDIKS